MKVTLIGTLLPIKGLRSYFQELIKSLFKNIEVKFIGFKNLYPDFLYRSTTKVDYENYKTPDIKMQKSEIF